jgi:hypothetical protein
MHGLVAAALATILGGGTPVVLTLEVEPARARGGSPAGQEPTASSLDRRLQTLEAALRAHPAPERPPPSLSLRPTRRVELRLGQTIRDPGVIASFEPLPGLKLGASASVHRIAPGARPATQGMIELGVEF